MEHEWRLDQIYGLYRCTRCNGWITLEILYNRSKYPGLSRLPSVEEWPCPGPAGEMGTLVTPEREPWMSDDEYERFCRHMAEQRAVLNVLEVQLGDK